jgi:regulator of nucleoside diphosphate kinase
MSSQPCLLTTKDYTILRARLEFAVLRDDPIAPLMQRKLSNAMVVDRSNIDPRVVTLNSRVRFCVGNAPSESRILIQEEKNGVVGLTIPIGVRRGLAMLGAREGDDIVVERPDGSTENIRVEEVAFQPEAHLRKTAAGGHPVKTKPRFKVISGGTAAKSPAPRFKSVGETDDFDPGPSAA